MQSMFDERLWLAWLVKVRIIILTFLLGIELAIARLTPSPLPLRLFVQAMLLWYTVSIFFVVLLSFWHEYRIQSLLQVLADMAMVTLVVYATGGVDSSLNFLYPLVIIVACILLPRSWAYLTAALAFILYGTILELTYFAVVPSYQTTHPGLRTLQAIILVNLFAFLAVAYLAALLSAKLRQVDVRLKHTRGALQNLQALHENIIQAISGGLVTTGLEGHITLVNATAQTLLERSERELMGQQIQQYFLDSLPQSGSDRAYGEVRMVTRNDFRKTFRVQVSELAVPERGALGYVYTFDDLTQIRRLEREVRMQDRLAAVGRLAAAIAHEIRNPLTSIAGSVSMLSGIPDLSEEHRQLLRIVTRESERLNSHYHRLSGIFSGQAISVLDCRFAALDRRHSHPAAESPGGRGYRYQDRTELSGRAGLDLSRWRQTQASLLESVGERGARHARRGIAPGYGAVGQQRLAGQLRRYWSGHEAATGRKDLRAFPVRI